MNVEKIKKNFSKLGVEIKIFFTLVLCADKYGAIKLPKPQLSKYLNVSAQTVGKYLKTFTECEMIKYKFSGKAIINPEFYYVGEPENLPKAIELYNNFKSDV